MGRNVSYHPPEGIPSDGQIAIARNPSTGSPLWRTYTKFHVLFNISSFTWTNQPSGITELFGLSVHRSQVDLTYCTQFRLSTEVITQGDAGAGLGIQYSLDSGSTWFGLDNGTEDILSTVEIDINSAIFQTTAWTNLIDASKVDVLLRFVGEEGNGILDPAFRKIEVQFR